MLVGHEGWTPDLRWANLSLGIWRPLQDRAGSVGLDRAGAGGEVRRGQEGLDPDRHACVFAC